jgi:hypothetical protein
MNPHIKSGVWAGGVVAISLGVAHVLSILNYGSLAQLAAAPLLPFIFGVGGGPHGAWGGGFEWLIYAIAFLAWWGVIDVCLRCVFPRRLHVVGALAVPVAWYGLVATAMFVVPRFRAINADPIPERTDLQEVCRIDGKLLTPLGTGPGNHVIVGEAARVALLGDSNQKYWLLHSPECTLQEAKLPPITAPNQIEALTNRGEILFGTTVNGPALGYVLLDAPTGKSTTGSRMPQPEQGPPNFPHFSSDGRWGAWLARPAAGKEEVQSATVERLEAGFGFSPQALRGEGVYRVIDVVVGGQGILLEHYPREYLLVDSAGSLIWAFRPDDGVLPTGDAIRLSADGKAYLAWDRSREEGRHVLQWRTNGPLVRKELPEHSKVFSAAVSSDWRWIAASSNANTKAGRGIDSVTVWSWDGTPRFHKRLKDDARTPVVFLDGNLFAYTEVDQQWHWGTRVLRLPEPGER